MRAPFSGLVAPNSFLRLISPGISAPASSLSFLPHSASEISFTLYGTYVVSTEDIISFFLHHKNSLYPPDFKVIYFLSGQFWHYLEDNTLIREQQSIT